MNTAALTLSLALLLTVAVPPQTDAGDLTITISKKVKGIMARKSLDQDVVHVFKGKDFILPGRVGLQSSYRIDFAHPPKLEEGPTSDPYKVIEKLTYLEKSGDEGGIRQLIEPHPDEQNRKIMDRPDVRQNVRDTFGTAKGVGILFGFEAENRFVVFYLIERPDRNFINVDELTKIGGVYYLRAQNTRTQLDYDITDIFTGLYAESHGQPGSITVKP